MDPDRYQSLAAGRVVRTGPSTASYYAFEPELVPRTLSFSEDTVLALSEADRALGNLAGLADRLPNPHVVVRPYLRREAVASTRIEGTQSSLEEVMAAEAQLQLLGQEHEVQEVLNYVRALEHGLARLADFPLSNRLLREMHAILLTGVRGAARTPGEFRRTQNWIGGAGPGEALFVPPPPNLVQDLMADLESFFHEEPRLPLLVRCALVHYQFETIHPFLDGNGRLGRLLIVVYLVEQGALRDPLLYLSAYLENHRGEYIDNLQRVRQEGDYEAWVHFFLTAVAVQARGSISTAEGLIRVASDFRERLRDIRARGHVIEAAELLIGSPYVTAGRLADHFGLSRQGAQYVLSSLQRAGILTRVPAAGRAALYVAPDVIRVLEPPE